MKLKLSLLAMLFMFMLVPGAMASVSIEYPTNTTYPTSPAWLNLTYTEPFDWSAYSIDGGTNQSFTEPFDYIGYNSMAGSVNQGVEVYGDYLWVQDHDGTLVRRYWKNNLTLIDSFVPRGYAQESYGICHNGTNLFTINRPDREVHMYYPNGTYTWFNFSIGGSNDWRSIDCNGSSIYIADILSDRIAEYSLGGGFIRNIDVSSQAPEPYGVTRYNDIFYVANRGYQGLKAVFKYYLNGTYTGEYVQINETTRVNDITTDGKYFWINSELYNRLHKYYVGNFTNIVNTTVSFTGDGLHNVTVYQDSTSDIVYFTIDSTAPTITVQSPANQTYAGSNVSLNVSADEVIDTWYYELNDTGNQSFSPNTTLTDLSDGMNHIEVWGNDSADNWGYAEVWFDMMVIPEYSEFTDNETTDFSSEPDINNVTDPVIANTYGKVEWTGSGYDFEGADLDANMEFSDNLISINSTALSMLDASATVTMKTTAYADNFKYNVLRNGVLCEDCVKLSSNPVSFTVTGFSNYTTESVGGIASTLDEAGTGLGGFLTAIESPLVGIVLALGIVGGILAVFYGIASVIRRAIGGAVSRFD